MQHTRPLNFSDDASVQQTPLEPYVRATTFTIMFRSLVKSCSGKWNDSVQFGKPLTFREPVLVVGATSLHHPLKQKTNVEYWLVDRKVVCWRTIWKRKVLNARTPLTMILSHTTIVSNSYPGGSLGPKPGSLTASSPLSPLLETIILLAHFIDQSLRTIIRPSSAPKKGAPRGRYSAGMHNTSQPS